MQTMDKRTNRQDRSWQQAIGGNLIVIGAVVALAAVALLTLVADPGGQVPTSPGARSAAVEAPAPPAASSADQDRSWLCNVISDDSAPESRVAVTEILARGGITCAPGELLDAQTAPAK